MEALVRGKLSRAEPHGTGSHSAGNPIRADAAPASLVTAAPAGGFGYSARPARLLLAFNFPDITRKLGGNAGAGSWRAPRHPNHDGHPASRGRGTP